jgi:trehalose 6-phosphate phosphatase
VVAVVSGRPASFLVAHLVPTGHQSVAEVSGSIKKGGTVRFVGLYGLEWSGTDGSITLEPGADRWRQTVDDVAGRLRTAAPPGVVVESKGLAVTVHWRQAPKAEPWAADAVDSESRRSGLRAHPGRLSVELRPPLDIDKGSTTRRLVDGCSAACYLGDDLGDLPAFAALADLAAERGMATASVAVVDGESDPAVAAAADVVVSGPGEAVALLRWLVDA